MKKIILLIMFIFIISSVSAVELCEYNGIKTTFNDQGLVMLGEHKNEVTDLEQIKGLTCLQSIDFYTYNVSGDIANLKDLVNLEYLSLHTNPKVYGDICSLIGLKKLKILKFAFDPETYGDISCLKDMNLEVFAMTYTNISGDISNLKHMSNLEDLYLTGTKVKGDISALAGLTNMEELTISDTESFDSEVYGDLSSLDNLQKLRKVALYNLDVSNCDQFTENHPNLEQGGCSEESKLNYKKTRNPNIVSQERLRELYPERFGNESKDLHEEPKDERSFFQKIIDWFKGFFS